MLSAEESQEEQIMSFADMNIMDEIERDWLMLAKYGENKAA
jgi:hypothetical protein